MRFYHIVPFLVLVVRHIHFACPCTVPLVFGAVPLHIVLPAVFAPYLKRHVPYARPGIRYACDLYFKLCGSDSALPTFQRYVVRA